MAFEVFKLFGTIMVNNEDANKSISDTGEKAEGTGNKFIKGIATVGKWGAAVAGAAVAGGTALLGMATKSAEATDRIDKLSNKIGISKQGFQEWDYIMGQNGMDVEKLQVGVKTLVSQMDAAAAGSKNATDSFNKLGLSWNDGNGKLKSQEQMMNEAMLALANMENGTEKARLATELFGKAGVEMMPMLNNGAEGIEDLRQRAHDLGLVLGDDAVNAGVVFGDTMDDVKDSLGMVTTQIGVGVMPIAQKMLDWFLTKMPLIQTVFGGVFNGISFFVTSFISVFSGVFNVIGDVLAPITSKVSEFIDIFNIGINDVGLSTIDAFGSAIDSIFGQKAGEVFDKFIALVVNIYNNTLPIVDGLKIIFSVLMDFLASVWTTVGQPLFSFIISMVMRILEVFNYIYPIIVDIFLQLCESLKNLWETVLKPVLDVIGFILQNVLLPIFEDTFNKYVNKVLWAFNFISEIWNTVLLPVLNGIIAFVGGIFSGNWSQVWNGIVGMLSGIWNAIKMILWTPIQWVIDKVSGIVESIVSPFRAAANSIANIWSSIKSVFKVPHFNLTGSLNPLKWLDEGVPKVGVEWYAKGGVLNKPTVFGFNGINAMVGGEAGPEAVAPISTLMDYIRTAVNQGNGKVDYEQIAQAFIKAILATGINKMNIFMGKDEVGQAMADTNDRINGNRISLTERGVVV